MSARDNLQFKPELAYRLQHRILVRLPATMQHPTDTGTSRACSLSTNACGGSGTSSVSSLVFGSKRRPPDQIEEHNLVKNLF
jgi:hypothetical protein